MAKAFSAELQDKTIGELEKINRRENLLYMRMFRSAQAIINSFIWEIRIRRYVKKMSAKYEVEVRRSENGFPPIMIIVRGKNG